MTTGNQRFASLAEALTSGLLVAGADGDVYYVNPAARELFWRTGEDLVGAGWLGAVHPEDRERVARCAEQVRVGGAAAIEELRIDVLGHTRWVRARFSAVPDDEADDARGWVAIIDDTTIERETSDEMAHRATHDPLTGLPNRMLLLDRLTRAIARGRRHDVTAAVFFVDLDRFKPVNDLHGHQAGDHVLRVVARRLQSVIRGDDTAARLGGDEFVVLAEGIRRSDAERLAGRLSEAVAGPISVGAAELSITASIGVVWIAQTDDEPTEVLDRADRAMYQAKLAGRPVAFAEDLTTAD